MAEEGTMNRRFRENMRRIREEKGWSQGELSRRLVDSGLSVFHQTTITRIENGSRPVKLDEAGVIAEALGVTLEVMTYDSMSAAVAGMVRQASEIRSELSVLGLRYVEAQHYLHKSLTKFEGSMEPGARDLATEVLGETAGDAAMIAVRHHMSEYGFNDYGEFVQVYARHNKVQRGDNA
ncbi:helix-turn-helix transcriptional regulator [Kocuria sp. CPCC 205263]|uniref:helix-turn-helix transcriptional regulator n=1 Tax=Kocuria sp. CPCC 205263 TaxID=3073555 RepID=UPI0034D511E3